MSEHLKQSGDLLRHQLGSIDLSDIEKLKDMKLTSGELANRAGDVETFYKSHFEKVLKLLLQKQLEFIGKEATDTEKLDFGRGSFNGLMLVKEWMEKEVRISMSRFDKGPKSNNGLGEI